MEGRCFCGSVFFLINERTPWSWGLAVNWVKDGCGRDSRPVLRCGK